MYVLKTTGLTKVFNQAEVVNSVNLNVKKGEIYGLLGPNGAGKTTIMKMMTNLVKPTVGEIEIFGEILENDSYETLKRIGAIIEYPVFYDKLTARENLELHCEYMGYPNIKEIDNVLELLKLKGTSKKAVREFSLGMKQRLGIARAILTKPEILILDEPINGLDPEGIREIRELLKRLSKDYGTTIIISSHILGEIEQMADTIGVIARGRLIKEVSMNSVREMNTEYIEVETKECKRAAYLLENTLKLQNFKVIGEDKIRIYDGSVSQNEISKCFILNGVDIDGILKKTTSLEEYFLKLVKGDGINA